MIVQTIATPPNNCYPNPPRRYGKSGKIKNTSTGTDDPLDSAHQLQQQQQVGFVRASSSSCALKHRRFSFGSGAYSMTSHRRNRAQQAQQKQHQHYQESERRKNSIERPTTTTSEIGTGNEAEEAGGNEDDSSTSGQLQGADISVMVVDDSPVKDGANNNNAINDTSSADSSYHKQKSPLSLRGKNTRGTCITESIMGYLNESISNQASAKSVWKKEEIEAQKEIKNKELALQQKNYFLSKRKINAEVEVMNQRCEVELEKTRKEIDLLEEWKKQLMQDRLKKLLFDRKELIDMGVHVDEVNTLLPLEK
jgi:hypothetical protein